MSKASMETLKHKDLLKAEIANKKLTNLLTQKMFKGYCNIKKWNKMKNDPHKMKQLVKSVEEQNYNPFAENYNLYYKTNIIGSLFPQIDFNPSIEINSATQMRTASTPKLNESKLFLTYEDKMGFNHSKQNNNNKYIQLNNKANNAQEQIQQTAQNQLSQSQRVERWFDPQSLYLNETEENVYSKFPFIIISKNQEEDCISNQRRPSLNRDISDIKRFSIKNKPKKNTLTASQSEFLFRISHRKDPSQYQMSFYRNKGLIKAKSINSIFYNKMLKEQDRFNLCELEIKNEIKQPPNHSNEKPMNRISVLQKGINEVFQSIENFEINFRFNDFFEEAKNGNSQKAKGKEDIKPDIDLPLSLPIQKPKPILKDMRPKTEQKTQMPLTQRNKANEYVVKMKNALLNHQKNIENKEMMKKQRRFHFSLSKEDTVTRKSESSIPKIYKKHSAIRDNQILSALYQNFDQKDIANILGSTKLMFNSLSQAKIVLKKKKSFVN